MAKSKTADALSKRPQSTATPLGTSKQKRSTKRITTKKENSASTEKVLDEAQTTHVASAEQQQTSADALAEPTQNETSRSSQTMPEITLTRDNTPRKGKSILFTSPQIRGAVRFPRTSFGETVPETIVINGDGFNAPKQKLTPEERKALRASQPKPTAAEKLQRAEARLAKLREKAAAEAAGTPAQG